MAVATVTSAIDHSLFCVLGNLKLSGFIFIKRPKVLTDSLRSMEADGIITRTVYPEVPPRVEYALSELGESMRPIIKSMEALGNNYKQRLEE